MSKPNLIDKAIAQLQGEIDFRTLAIQRLREQQQKPVKPRIAKPRAVTVKEQAG